MTRVDLSPARAAHLERVSNLRRRERDAVPAALGRPRPAPPAVPCRACGDARWRPDGGDLCVGCELAQGPNRAKHERAMAEGFSTALRAVERTDATWGDVVESIAGGRS